MAAAVNDSAVSLPSNGARSVPMFVRRMLEAPTSQPRVSVDYLTWEILRLLEGRPLVAVSVACSSDAQHRSRGRVDLRFEFGNEELWVIGIRYGLPPMIPGFPSRHMLDLDTFYAAPTDPESSRLALVDRQECLATAAQVVSALQAADTELEVAWTA